MLHYIKIFFNLNHDRCHIIEKNCGKSHFECNTNYLFYFFLIADLKFSDLVQVHNLILYKNVFFHANQCYPGLFIAVVQYYIIYVH